jgi:lipopolysaccharide transport system ATP-binding protein
MSNIALEFRNVSKKFRKGESYDSLRDLIPGFIRRTFLHKKKTEELKEREFWALKEVSFRVGRGEAFGIIGPNGSGKSTSLKLLCGILKPTMGEIFKKGRISALIEVGAGFHPDLTGRENIYLNGAILGMKKSEIDKKLESIIDFSGISDFIDTPVKRYSSGMYARLGFSIAVHVDPEILLVDEVLSVGDYTFQGKCIQKMNDILKNGTTVIYVSHNMESVLSLCDRAILLCEGIVRKEGGPAEVIAEYYNEGGSWSPILSEAKKASIIDINFECADTLEMAVKPGTPLKCKVLIKCIEDCKISPGLFITQKGAFLFDTTYARMRGGQNLAVTAGEELEVVWRIDLNLPGGSYDIGLHLEDIETGKYHEHFFRVKRLLVADDHRYEGKYIMNPTIESYVRDYDRKY